MYDDKKEEKKKKGKRRKSEENGVKLGQPRIFLGLVHASLTADGLKTRNATNEGRRVRTH